MTDISSVLAEREKTHGHFGDVSLVSQNLKLVLRSGPSWASMSDRQKEAAEAICGKLARLVCGDPSHPDHFLDVGGYAHLGAGHQT